MKAKGSTPPNHPPDAPWDWLGFAIHQMGGPGQAAQRLGVSRQTLYTYLEEGLGSAKFSTVLKIAKETRIPLEYLREGAPDPAHV
jgi:DNA-binding phage protein